MSTVYKCQHTESVICSLQAPTIAPLQPEALVEQVLSERDHGDH